MSIPEYKDGQFISTWDFECPSCGAFWDNTGDNPEQDEEVDEECPKCGAEFTAHATWTLDYELTEKPKINAASTKEK